MNQKRKFALAVHGGSGTILRAHVSQEKESRYHGALSQALLVGQRVLASGGSALDAVEAAIVSLEDEPLFNAGRGAVYTHEGLVELDASIMEGSSLSAGAVAALTRVKNPIKAARCVMEKSGHVMLAGKGADAFAESHGIETVDPEYYFTQERWNALLRVRNEDPSKTELDHGNPEDRDEKFGTVGAVALDSLGNLAAATSTGGMTNKRFGRVGDSPLIGCGTYANHIAAISCTGWGEFFIRTCAAKTVCDLMAYRQLSLEDAAAEVINRQIPALGGDGGLIAVDSAGNISMPFSTEGMYRGCIREDGKIFTGIFRG